MAIIFVPDITVAEKVVRSVIVYAFLLVAFRLAGKRQLGQLTAFDLVVLLVISNVVQHALSTREFRSALRQQRVLSVADVPVVILEEDGHVSVIPKRPPIA